MVRLGGEVDLVHRRTRSIKKLQRFSSVRIDGPGVSPVGKEHAQIDVRTQDNAHRLARTYIFITPVAFMHAPFVTRQRHDPTQAAEFTKNVLRRFAQRYGAQPADAGRHQLEFGHTQLHGDSAYSGPRFAHRDGVVATAQFLGLFLLLKFHTNPYENANDSVYY